MARRQTRRRKEKKNVELGVAHIQSTFNNRLGVRRYLLRSYGMDTRTLYRLHIAANLLDDRIEQRLHAYRRMVEPNRKAIRLSFLFEPFGIRFELGQNAIKIRKNDNRDTIVRSKRRKSFFQSALSHRTENSRRKRIHRRWRNRFVQRLRTGQSN